MFCFQPGLILSFRPGLIFFFQPGLIFFSGWCGYSPKYIYQNHAHGFVILNSGVPRIPAATHLYTRTPDSIAIPAQGAGVYLYIYIYTHFVLP